jgi:hypothetical protein
MVSARSGDGMPRLRMSSFDSTLIRSRESTVHLIEPNGARACRRARRCRSSRPEAFTQVPVILGSSVDKPFLSNGASPAWYGLTGRPSSSSRHVHPHPPQPRRSLRAVNASNHDRALILGMNGLRGAHRELDRGIECFITGYHDQIGVGVTYSMTALRGCSQRLGSTACYVLTVNATVAGEALTALVATGSQYGWRAGRRCRRPWGACIWVPSCSSSASSIDVGCEQSSRCSPSRSKVRPCSIPMTSRSQDEAVIAPFACSASDPTHWLLVHHCGRSR